jgi:hypothetical protein
VSKLQARIDQIVERIHILNDRRNGTIVVSEQNKLAKEIKSLNKEKEKLLKKFNPN